MAAEYPAYICEAIVLLCLIYIPKQLQFATILPLMFAKAEGN